MRSLLAQTVMLTVCTVVLVGFVILMAMAIARVTVHMMDSITPPQSSSATTTPTGGRPAGAGDRDVSDVSGEMASWRPRPAPTGSVAPHLRKRQ